MRFMILALLGAALLAGEPRFDNAGVLFANRNFLAQVMPGMEVSIYGTGLGPQAACKGSHDPARPVSFNPALPEHWKTRDMRHYPLELCGVQVKLSGLAAELMYVQDEQINFRVPQMVPLGGEVELAIFFGGESSAALTLETGLQVMKASIKGSVYTDMPVWIDLDGPEHWLPRARYPFDVAPQDSGCNEVELRRNGVLLERTWRPMADYMIFRSVCGGLSSGGDRLRLPLHLMHRLDKPGRYEARVVAKANQGPEAETIGWSNWVSFEVSPAQAGMRSALLARLRENVPTDRDALLGDYLPSLLGVPDKASFEVLSGFLDHENTYVRMFAAQGYRYWELEPPRVGGVM